ncbi:hypothetical protein N7501_010528 [Penicillium viridicatum]|nr:hypothetical protein N7501_010528 [Penicillium viridicatum]
MTAFLRPKGSSSRSDLPDIKQLSAIDTLHNREELKALANYSGNGTRTEEEEKKLLRRINWRLMPIYCFVGVLYWVLSEQV